MKLLSFDVLHCWRKNSIVGDIIKDVTETYISHTALYIEIYGIGFIIDSQWDGTRFRSFKDWQNKYNYSYHVSRRIGLIDQEDLTEKVQKYVNRMYGFVDLIRHLIMRYFNVWLGSKREDKNLVCSEFVMRIFGNKDAYKATPKDALKWCKENGFKIVDTVHNNNN